MIFWCFTHYHVVIWYFQLRAIDYRDSQNVEGKQTNICSFSLDSVTCHWETGRSAVILTELTTGESHIHTVYELQYHRFLPHLGYQSEPHVEVKSFLFRSKDTDNTRFGVGHRKLWLFIFVVIAKSYVYSKTYKHCCANSDGNSAANSSIYIL